MTYGYARVSTTKQSIDRQMENIHAAYGGITIYNEKITGKSRLQDRTQWTKLMKVIRTGDTIVFDEVSRMSRDANDGIADYMELYNKGINLIFLKEPHINTSVFRDAINNQIASVGNEIADIYIDATNKVLRILAEKQIRIAFEKAQSERDLLGQRTSEGMRESGANEKIRAARSGKNYTRKQELICRDIITSKSKSFDGIYPDDYVLIECNKALNKIGCKSISRTSYYRYKDRLCEN